MSATLTVTPTRETPVKPHMANFHFKYIKGVYN